MIPARRLLAVIAAGAVLGSAAPAPAQAVPSPAELQQYAEARRRSDALRARLDALAHDVRDAIAAGGRVPPESAERLREHKREYFALRQRLFELALRHASAIVERLPARDRRAALLKTSLSLGAGTQLVENFHAVAVALGESAELRDVWSEADPAHAIPASSWELSMTAYRNVEYQTLFRDAIDRLQKHRPQLDGYHAKSDGAFRTLYPQGIEAGLGEAERSYALLRAGLAEEDLGEDERELRRLVERSKIRRAEWAAAAPAIREAFARDGGLVRGDLHLRLQGIRRDHLDVRESLYRLGFKHVPKLSRQDIPYPTAFRLRAVSISLLAGVTLYENARQIAREIVTIPGVRAVLNQVDPALGVHKNFWEQVEHEFYKIEYRNLLDAGARLMEAAQPPPYSPDPEEDPLLAYVSRELAAGAAVVEIRGDAVPRQIARVLRHYVRQVTTRGLGAPKEAKFQLSKGFGNLVGVVELRKGKLFGQSQWIQFVRERLRPGDLLLDKTPFRLTDTFIPGHFGHVALYVGTERELGELGLWRHPFVAPYRQQVAAGRTIVEALRDGTQINTIEHFLNIDDLAILRPKPSLIPPADVVQAIKLAFSHIGKKYDFGFDNNTWDAIVCSELAFQTYVNVPWAAARVLTAYTIAPDDVAMFAGADPARPFELVTFVHDGRVVHDRATGVEGVAAYVRLLGTRYVRATRSLGAPPPPHQPDGGPGASDR